MIISFPIMFFLVTKIVTDTNYFNEDTVIPPEHICIKNANAEAQEYKPQ